MEHNDALEHHDHPGYITYIMIWMSLIILTGLTVAASGFDAGALNTPIALFIASVKSILVILFFMHIKFESNMFKLMLFLCFLTLIVIIGITFIDYDFRT